LGLQEQEKGDRALAQNDYAGAKAAYEAAAGYFQEAKTEAAKNVELARTGTERQREAAMAVKRVTANEKAAAERAKANTLAAALFNEGLRLERDGEAKAAEENWSAAQQAYAGARESYKRAKDEVTRMAAAMTRENAGAARNEMIRNKQQVFGRDEDKRAHPKYARALLAEAAGEQQLQNGDFANAQNSFNQARSLYAEAARELLTAAKNQAAEAQTGMLQARANVDQATSSEAKYREAERRRVEGENAYSQNDFETAAAQFKAAQALYNAVAVEAAEKRAKQTDARTVVQRELQSLINRLTASLENRDFDGFKAVYGQSFTRNDERAWSGFFEMMKDIQAQFRGSNLVVNSNRAQVEITGKIDYVNNRNEPQSTPFKQTWVLEQINGQWVIVLH
jgi:hypothetical protein